MAPDGELDVLPEQPSQKWLDRGDHRAQIDDLGRENLLSAEGEQLPSQLRGALGALLDQLDVPAVRIMGRQVEEEELAAAGDDRQQVVEVMRHTSREPPDGLHLLCLAKLFVDLHQLSCAFLDPRFQPIVGRSEPRLRVTPLRDGRGHRQDGHGHDAHEGLQQQQGFVDAALHERTHSMNRVPDGDGGREDRRARRPAGTEAKCRPYQPWNGKEGQRVLGLRAREPPAEPHPTCDQQRHEQQPCLDAPADARSGLRRATPRQQ